MERLKETNRMITNLWRLFCHGDYAVFGEIFQYLYHELYYYGLKLTPIPELVKDTIQDIFVDVWHRKEKMAEVKNIKAYLLVALRRELLKRVQKLRTESILEDQKAELFVFSAEDFLIQKETDRKITDLLLQSLEKLTSRQREVILLRFNYELEFHEISQVMDMNIQSVRNILFRALENVRKDLDSGDIEGFVNIGVFLFSLFGKKNVNFS